MPHSSFDPLISIRKELHSMAELSGKEFKTAAFIQEKLHSYKPHQLLSGLGGTGILATFDSGVEGPWLMFRAELDALPILEANEFSHKSINAGVSHKCGHDGHMSILLGLGKRIADHGLQKGKVSLLFQPAEEIGQGARTVLEDPQWPEPAFDFVFALHNLPGFPLGEVQIREGILTPSVCSLAVNLTGKTSHAAEPQKGINPDRALMEIFAAIKGLEQADPQHPHYLLVTTIHLLLGSVNYGISPAEAELHFTLRTLAPDHMPKVQKQVEELIQRAADKDGLKIKCEWVEEFQANVGNKEAVEWVKRAALAKKIPFQELEQPLAFGEDFGLFTQRYKGAMFGLGAGEGHPDLHHDTYDFPDELIPIGIEMFWGLVKAWQ